MLLRNCITYKIKRKYSEVLEEKTDDLVKKGNQNENFISIKSCSCNRKILQKAQEK